MLTNFYAKNIFLSENLITVTIFFHDFMWKIFSLQAFAALVNTGRLEKKNIDVEPYVVDGVTKLSELPHGIRKWYYWGPCYGEQAVPELAVFTK